MLGKRFKDYEVYFPGRTYNQIKSQYHNYKNKQNKESGEYCTSFVCPRENPTIMKSRVMNSNSNEKLNALIKEQTNDYVQESQQII